MTFIADNYEIITAFSSIIIATLAIFLSLNEGSSNRKHNRLSVRTYIVLHQYKNIVDKTYYHSIALENNGLGPAIIKSYEVFHDGVMLGDRTDEEALISKIDKKVSEFGVATEHGRVVFRPGNAIPANSTEHLIKICTSNVDRHTIGQIDSFVSKFKIVIEYNSIYNEKDCAII